MAELGPSTYSLNAEQVKSQATRTATLDVVNPNGVALYVPLGIESHRKLEVVEGWRWLYNGLRDRNLVPEVLFPGGNLYTAAPLNSLVEFSRNTSTDPVIIIAGSIGVGIGLNLRNDPAVIGRGASDATNIIENTIKRLIEFAREHTLFRI